MEFSSRADMKTALEKLDDTEINGRRIRLVEDRSRSRRRRCLLYARDEFCCVHFSSLAATAGPTPVADTGLAVLAADLAPGAVQSRDPAVQSTGTARAAA